MYRLSPLEGESEVVLRQVAGIKEYRFSDRRGAALRLRSRTASRPTRAGPRSCPTRAKEMKTLRKDRKRVMTTAVLVDLATAARRNSRRCAAWPFPATTPVYRSPPLRPESQEKEKDKWSVRSLLHDLATAKEVNIGNVAEYAFDKAGARLAPHRRPGQPATLQLRT